MTFKMEILSCSVVEELSGASRKQVQKILYLLSRSEKIKTGAIHYKWRDFGPYSRKLEKVINRLVKNEFLLKSSGVIAPTEKTQEVTKRLGDMFEEKEVDFFKNHAIPLLREFDSEDLEIIASLDFLSKRRDKNEATEKMEELQGDRFSEDELLKGWRKLGMCQDGLFLNPK